MIRKQLGKNSLFREENTSIVYILKGIRLLHNEMTAGCYIKKEYLEAFKKL
jgi:hypothetical protein